MAQIVILGSLDFVLNALQNALAAKLMIAVWLAGAVAVAVLTARVERFFTGRRRIAS